MEYGWIRVYCADISGSTLSTSAPGTHRVSTTAARRRAGMYMAHVCDWRAGWPSWAVGDWQCVTRSFTKLSAFLPVIAHVFLFLELFLTLAERRLQSGGSPLEAPGGCRPPLSGSRDERPARRGGVPFALASSGPAEAPLSLRTRLSAPILEVPPVFHLATGAVCCCDGQWLSWTDTLPPVLGVPSRRCFVTAQPQMHGRDGALWAFMNFAGWTRSCACPCACSERLLFLVVSARRVADPSGGVTWWHEATRELVSLLSVCKHAKKR